MPQFAAVSYPSRGVSRFLYEQVPGEALLPRPHQAIGDFGMPRSRTQEWRRNDQRQGSIQLLRSVTRGPYLASIWMTGRAPFYQGMMMAESRRVNLRRQPGDDKLGRRALDLGGNRPDQSRCRRIEVAPHGITFAAHKVTGFAGRLRASDRCDLVGDLHFWNRRRCPITAAHLTRTLPAKPDRDASARPIKRASKVVEQPRALRPIIFRHNDLAGRRGDFRVSNKLRGRLNAIFPFRHRTAPAPLCDNGDAPSPRHHTPRAAGQPHLRAYR